MVGEETGKKTNDLQTTLFGQRFGRICLTVILYGAMVECQSPFLCEGHIEITSIWSKSLSRYFPQGDIMIADARIDSALIKIIQKTQCKKKVSLEEQKAQKEDRLLRGRQIAFMIYDYFRVTGAHHTVLDCSDFFSIRNFDYETLKPETRELRLE